MRFCKNLILFFIATVLISIGIGILIAKIIGLISYIIAIAIIAAGVFIIFTC